MNIKKLFVFGVIVNDKPYGQIVEAATFWSAIQKLHKKRDGIGSGSQVIFKSFKSLTYLAIYDKGEEAAVAMAAMTAADFEEKNKTK